MLKITKPGLQRWARIRCFIIAMEVHYREHVSLRHVIAAAGEVISNDEQIQLLFS